MSDPDLVIANMSWCQAPLQDLLTRLDHDTLPAAIALVGSAGWGVDLLAAELTRHALQLPEKANQPDVLREYAHPDLRWIEPDGVELKIDQVRSLIDFAVQTAQTASRKIAVICEAERLNENAANALLKILEEPPPGTHLILLTHNWGRMLPTVRSRTQRWQVPPDSAAALAWLSSQGIDMDEMTFDVQGAAPLTIYAKNQLADGTSAFDISEWLLAATQRPVTQSLSLAGDIDTADLLELWFRRIKLHLSLQPLPEITASPRRLHEFSDQLLSVRRQITTRNSARSSAGLLVEGLLIDWRRICAATTQ